MVRHDRSLQRLQEVHLEIISNDKGHVVENTANLTGAMEGVQVVRLDMKLLGERRYRLRTPGGSEARVTEAENRHCQETRNHRTPGVYQVDKGWIACVTKGTAGGVGCRHGLCQQRLILRLSSCERRLCHRDVWSRDLRVHDE